MRPDYADIEAGATYNVERKVHGPRGGLYDGLIATPIEARPEAKERFGMME
jgi:hypothetical protein